MGELWLYVSSFQSWPVSSSHRNFVPLRCGTPLWRWSAFRLQGLLAEFMIHCGPGICSLEKLSWVILSCNQIWDPLLRSTLHSRKEPFKRSLDQALENLDMEGRRGNTCGSWPLLLVILK